MSKFTKKFDRAFQWAGEKMGNEARTGTTEEFKSLETEMALRFDGMVKLQTTMNAYVKWLAHRDTLVGEKGVPTAVMGRTMIAHGEDFDHNSQFGNCLIEMGRTNDQVANFQEQYTNDATKYWADSLERSVAMMKEYQNARKKLESRRLALDASTTKMQKAKRDDFRLEEELRTAKAKYEEANEDVYRRMLDIQDAEADSIRDLTRFLDVELDYHERCADALRQTRATWTGADPIDSYGASRVHSHNDYTGGGSSSNARRPSARSRSNTAQSNSLSRTNSYTPHEATPTYEEPDEMPSPSRHMRVPIRSQSRISVNSAASSSGGGATRDRSPAPPRPVSRPGIARAATYSLSRTTSAGAGGVGAGLSIVPPPPMPTSQTNVASLRGQLRPTGQQRASAMDVFRDDDDTDRSDTPPRSASPATTYSNSSRTNLNGAGSFGGAIAGKKAPPAPPSRAKKPPPPVPNRREREV